VTAATAPAHRPTLLFLHPAAGTGGAEEVLVAAVRGLAEEFGILVVLMTHGELEARLRDAGAEVIVEELPGRLSIARYPFAARRLARRLDGRGVALVHANQVKAVLFGIPLARRLGVPLLWMKHGHDFDRVAPRFLGPRCDWIVCVTGAVAATFPESCRERISVVNPGVDLPESTTAPGEDAVVLSVGTLIPTKGHDTLIRALAELRALDVPARLEIAGSEHRVAPGHLAELRRLADELGVAGQVEFLGWIDMAAAYARCRVVGLASRPAREGTPAEGAPLALLEAMAHARPFVAPEEPGIAEIAGDAGTLVADTSATGFARALEPYLRDRERAAAAGAAGRARVEKRFTIAHMVDGLRTTYTRLIRRGPA
jgi:glycosyltransferase involved in cell wall biosynthesis